MLPTIIHLRARNPKLTRAWEEVFAPFDNIEVVQGDYFEQPADAMLSPANSFGIMDGGLDAAIVEQLGYGIQDRVQEMILRDWHGEMPVGAAAIVETSHETWPFLVVAPTMRVPENVSLTLNAYLAFRAALLAVKRFNENTDNGRIYSLLVSGLGTGVGGMDPRRCAAQMHVAYRYLVDEPRIPSFKTIYEVHKKIKNAM